MRRFTSSTFRGCEVVDPAGQTIGIVADVWPRDGGGEAELALVHVGRRFKRPRYLPLDGRAYVRGRLLHVPWSRLDVEESPSAEDRRWGDPAQVAQAYWRDASD